ncbi:hypothetical protein ACYCS5_27805 [Paenibacillus sp. SEL3]|uniref:Uncharacterized protein n=1 Tax=Paenibacillus ottowii TaxID=2315729 RepID=A0ABY3AXJ2_9BACL|nr:MULTISPECIES: hypothetical protein [Paenibacillus]AIW40112.1 hypothetical protein X809_29005 [Paenibacillus polymyxa CR1]ALA42371.1 hypothetical protein ABE82_12995 [Paenibacillus peoriae]APB75899.1 hypothetical protein PPYC2_13385 [Paenibacillus polymyxa]MBO3287199.1 hypothetical protein [Paenibacillus polymyxa]MBP1312393.1 hypothetical protein [Paenibacillus sp. 1182]
MARPVSFSSSDLAWECAQVKRKLLNDVKKGRLSRLSKSDVYDMIAKRPRIRLKSSRMLWTGSYKEYLEKWFTKLNEEIQLILDSASEGEPTITSPEIVAQEHRELQAKVTHLTQLISTYKDALDELRIENGQYRELISQRFGDIDLF